MLKTGRFLARIEVPKDERVLLLVDGQPTEMLGAGVHKRWAIGKRIDARATSLHSPLVSWADAELLATDPVLGKHFRLHRIGDGERGLLFKNDNLLAILLPATHVLLSDAPGVRIDTVTVATAPLLPPELRARITALTGHLQFVRLFNVMQGQKGLFYLDNVLQPALCEPGTYAFWIGTPDARIEAIDVREQTLEVQGQELMTQDKVSLRLNLSARVQVSNPVLAVTAQSSYRDALYRELQLALRTLVSALTFDELLQKKEELGAQIKAQVDAACGSFGVSVLGAGIRDVILPGEMRVIMNQVIEAEKRAAANLIARREETAATRNLLNTARMLESSPVLMRLKEIEAAERIAEKIQHLSVYGGLDAFLGLVRPEKPAPT